MSFRLFRTKGSLGATPQRKRPVVTRAVIAGPIFGEKEPSDSCPLVRRYSVALEIISSRVRFGLAASCAKRGEQSPASGAAASAAIKRRRETGKALVELATMRYRSGSAGMSR